jgi:glycosyltransferase involved in cell wall biosynthesis
MARRAPSGWVAVAWAPYSRRSEMFARELGGALHCIHNLRFQSPPLAPLKYPIQAVRTVRMLFRERPAAVHVQDPPFVCGLVVAFYCSISGASFVTEFHSAAFGRAWRWAVPIQRRLVRRAAMNVVTSEHWSDIVGSWGGRTVVMHDPFLPLPEGEPYPLGAGPNIAVASTFADDEPVAAVLEAAEALPDVHFWITGDPRQRARLHLPEAPPNVTYTGFLDGNGEYLGLMRGADAVVALTTRDHTLQLAGCEAIAVGTPLITSDWAYLRELFGGGTVFVGNDAESIARGVRDILERGGRLRAEIDGFRRARRLEWTERLDQLRGAVAGRPSADAAPPHTDPGRPPAPGAMEGARR